MWRARLRGFVVDGEALLHAPRDEHLRRRRTQPIGDLPHLGVIHELLQAREVVPEGAVRGDVDVVLLGVLDQVVLGEEGVALDLVDDRDDAGGFDDAFDVLDREVGDADGAHFAFGEDGFHLGPGLAQGPVADDVAVAVRERGERGVVALWVQVDRPVDEED